MLTEKESSWDDILSRGICVVVKVGGVCICKMCRRWFDERGFVTVDRLEIYRESKNDEWESWVGNRLLY